MKLRADRPSGSPFGSEDPPLSGALYAGLSSVARPSGHQGPDPWLCVPPSREVCSFRREVFVSAREQGLCQTNAITVLFREDCSLQIVPTNASDSEIRLRGSKRRGRVRFPTHRTCPIDGDLMAGARPLTGVFSDGTGRHRIWCVAVISALELN